MGPPGTIAEPCYEPWMKKKSEINRLYDRRSLLYGLGAAGLSLVAGGCTTAGSAVRADPDIGAADAGPAAADRTLPPMDKGFIGADGGLPPIDLEAPGVTQTATFALG